jgi:hypothetical protein
MGNIYIYSVDDGENNRQIITHDLIINNYTLIKYVNISPPHIIEDYYSDNNL